MTNTENYVAPSRALLRVRYDATNRRTSYTYCLKYSALAKRVPGADDRHVHIVLYTGEGFHYAHSVCTADLRSAFHELPPSGYHSASADESCPDHETIHALSPNLGEPCSNLSNTALSAYLRWATYPSSIGGLEYMVSASDLYNECVFAYQSGLLQPCVKFLPELCYSELDLYQDNCADDATMQVVADDTDHTPGFFVKMKHLFAMSLAVLLMMSSVMASGLESDPRCLHFSKPSGMPCRQPTDHELGKVLDFVKQENCSVPVNKMFFAKNFLPDPCPASSDAPEVDLYVRAYTDFQRYHDKERSKPKEGVSCKDFFVMWEGQKCRTPSASEMAFVKDLTENCYIRQSSSDDNPFGQPHCGQSAVTTSEGMYQDIYDIWFREFRAGRN